MIKTIATWLLKPYPFPTTIKNTLFISLGFGAFVFLFLFLFSPFKFDSLEDRQLFFSLGYGIITATILAIYFLTFPLIFKKASSTWTTYKMLLFAIGVLLLISIANTIFSREYGILDKQNNLFTFFIGKTVLVGIFPILAYIYLVERIANKKHRVLAETISKNVIKKASDKKTLILNGKNKNDQIEILMKDFLYISSEKNYASIFHFKNGKITESLLRNSLNKIELQLRDYTSIVRCHKSFIVNTSQVVKIKGNARGYFLSIKNNDFLIPVSRTFPKELLFTLTDQASHSS